MKSLLDICSVSVYVCINQFLCVGCFREHEHTRGHLSEVKHA